MAEPPLLSIIVPAFNEAKVLTETIIRLKKTLLSLSEEKKISTKSNICFVDDGSNDTTWVLIETFHKTHDCVKGIKLTRNFGHQNAVIAGLFSFTADIFITIDADLQDDEHAIVEMIDKYMEGSHVVYGVRQSRESDSIFKQLSAKSFYRLMQFLKVDSIYNHADYRLMSKTVVEELKNFSEINLFLRAIVPLIGFKSDIVYYDRKERFAGESKYNLAKMLSFAWNGITSFSIFPIKLITIFGFLIFILSCMASCYSFLHWFQGKTTPGWTSTMLPIFMFGGVQLLSIGVIGEYIGKIYQEVKNRPRFIIEKEL